MQNLANHQGLGAVSKFFLGSIAEDAEKGVHSLLLFLFREFASYKNLYSILQYTGACWILLDHVGVLACFFKNVSDIWHQCAQ